MLNVALVKRIADARIPEVVVPAGFNQVVYGPSSARIKNYQSISGVGLRSRDQTPRPTAGLRPATGRTLINRISSLRDKYVFTSSLKGILTIVMPTPVSCESCKIRRVVLLCITSQAAVSIGPHRCKFPDDLRLQSIGQCALPLVPCEPSCET